MLLIPGSDSTVIEPPPEFICACTIFRNSTVSLYTGIDLEIDFSNRFVIVRAFANSPR
ncbi:MAG: hypothetical protein F6K48_11405 [Okeania sp. SIO3H1]|uniref:hypothetical protein n=1 Tax=Okeania sp. SIO1I7 TaxID=2607772 RepID=UPI0013CA2BD5|nr:hypothetical protein [Okeania sp. SIO1I7]NEN89468.1 hypothetical protein [Okeania sp. SIO3H1]NET29404.1 hypothetical protein [Okeania sp. SIO1I7]